MLARKLEALMIIHPITLDLYGPCSVIVSRSFIIYWTHQWLTSNCEYLPICRDILFAPWAFDFDVSSDFDISAPGRAMIVLLLRMYFAKCYSLKSTKKNLIKNLHRKIATWPYYYYCPLVDLLIYILCGVSIIMSSIWLKNCISANTAERDSPPSEITGGINITERKNQHRSSFL